MDTTKSNGEEVGIIKVWLIYNKLFNKRYKYFYYTELRSKAALYVISGKLSVILPSFLPLKSEMRQEVVMGITLNWL